jgi:hypothetical protein
MTGTILPGDLVFQGIWKAAPGIRAPALRERGRRRTRQDQIAPASIADEIADLRSAPNEENLFLLPDRFSERANSFRKIRSSRLT